MKIGKLPPHLLEQMVFEKLAKNNTRRKEMIIRPSIGEDCATLSLGEEYAVFSADPITGATAELGALAVHVNVNDVAACGAEPVGIMITLLLPPTSTEKTLEAIMDGVIKAANETGIEVIGGHTEVTDAVNRPIISAAIIGKTRNKNVIYTGGALVGQALVMTKWAGLEGTAILAKDKADLLKETFDQAFLSDAAKASELISVIQESRIASDFGVSAMHDITEGGVLGACYEMAEASGVGVEVYIDDIPLLDTTKRLCQFLQIDPFKLISSGSMLIATSNPDQLIEALATQGIHAATIGKLIKQGKTCVSKNGSAPLHQPDSDELYRIIH